MDKYKVRAHTGCSSKGKNCKNTLTGTWTPISDQAFEVALENNQRFVANYKYTLKSSVSKNPLLEGVKAFTSLRDSDYDKFNSECDKTMVGFVQNIPTANDTKFDMRDHNIRCFHAEQIKKDNIEKIVSYNKGPKTFKDSFIIERKPEEEETL